LEKRGKGEKIIRFLLKGRGKGGNKCNQGGELFVIDAGKKKKGSWRYSNFHREKKKVGSSVHWRKKGNHNTCKCWERKEKRRRRGRVLPVFEREEKENRIQVRLIVPN